MTGIYKIENLINGKVYIGQSQNISQRWIAHRNRPFNTNASQYDSPLYRAIRKYGLENFSFEVLEEVEKDKLDEREIYWISNFKSNDSSKGYNLTTGGGAITNGILTLEEVHEIYNLLLNTNLSQEEIANKYGISQRSVSGINTGQTWVEIGRIYPIRKLKIEEKRCCDCGIKISHDSIRCSSCEKKRRQKELPITREELKKLIRSTSFLQIGKKFGISDNAIRKWCKKYNLPSTKKEINSYSEEEWELL
jgi:group I intron endonuclease